MHSYITNSAVFFFDGSFVDGDLIIHPLDKDGNCIDFGDKEIRIDANDILKLVAYKYIKDELISRIEDMHWRELLLRGMSK